MVEQVSVEFHVVPTDILALPTLQPVGVWVTESRIGFQFKTHNGCFKSDILNSG